MDSPTLTVVNSESGEQLTLTYDNTMLMIFGGDTTLDHVQYTKQDGRHILLYSGELIQAVFDRRFPIYARSDRPDFAIERFMAVQTNDCDKLLQSE